MEVFISIWVQNNIYVAFHMIYFFYWLLDFQLNLKIVSYLIQFEFKNLSFSYFIRISFIEVKDIFYFLFLIQNIGFSCFYKITININFMKNRSIFYIYYLNCFSFVASILVFQIW